MTDETDTQPNPSDPGDVPSTDEVKFGAIFRRLGPVGPIAILSSTVPALALLTLAWWINPTGSWLRGLGDWGVPAFLAIFSILSGTALVPARVQSILAGWSFNFALGLPAAIGAYLGGAAVGFVIARRASGDRVVKLVEQHPKWRAVYRALVGGGFWKTLGIVALLRFPPNSPFALTNLVLAAGRVSPAPYFLGTLLGMAPRTALVVYVAAQLTALDAKKPVWMIIAGIVATIIVLVVLAAIGNRAIARVTGVDPAVSPSTAGDVE